MTIQEFTARIKQNHSAYRGLSDNDLAVRVLEKYPQYREQIDPQEMQQFAQNQANNKAVSSALFSGGPFMNADVNRGAMKGSANTISGMSQLGQRGLSWATGIKPVSQNGSTGPFVTDNGITKLQSQYTNPSNVGESIGFNAEQIGEYFAPAGGTSKLTGLATKGIKGSGFGSRLLRGSIGAGIEGASMAGVGAAQKGTTDDLVGDTLMNTALLGGLKASGSLIKRAGEGMYGSAIPTTPTQKAILRKRGVNLGKEMIRDIGPTKSKGAFVKKSANAMNKYKKQANKIIQKIDKTKKGYTIPKNSLFKGMDKELQKMIDVSPEASRKSVEKAFMNELKAATRRAGKGKNLKFSQVNELKHIFDKKINYNRIDPISTVQNAVDKKIADNARRIIGKVSPEIEAINAKIGPLAEASRILQKKGGYSGYLTDVIAGANAPSLSGAAKNILFKRLLTSFPAITTGGSTLSKLGSGMASPQGSRAIRGWITKQT